MGTTTLTDYLREALYADGVNDVKERLSAYEEPPKLSRRH